ncbi:MAG: acetyl/propionyl-CoA carboxylase subunit alpha [Pseudonocardiaceae bacterium]|nr:acetyl/propionyl-CoA carboxylase subunit alpha [Pseudonocardiaceae bacterium]
MFDTVLIANRGEIAVRVIRTLRALGIRSVAVYSDADADARHVHEADVSVHIGPTVAAESYLSIERIVDAALRTGAQAVHPGYGFLAENAGFARACADAGLAFVGPPAAAIETMGDKIRAKQTVAAAGVPVVPGRSEPGLSDADLVAAAGEIGYPVLLKPSAGGGGKGMRRVDDPGALREAIAGARREARGAFGDDTLLLERFVADPRHIEIQVLADAHGTVVHLGERECSLQRRHQKIVEEAPSPLLPKFGDGEVTRQRMGSAAVEAARAVGYTGAGTVEFIVSAAAPGEFFFLETNTRLQVEHPVTELVTGYDLVEMQLRVAAGEALPLRQQDVALHGHAVEARIYAETVSLREGARGFLPTGGRVLALAEPEGPGIRVDSGLAEGTEVGGAYDPMLAKVIAHGPDRSTALRRLDGALARTTVLGVGTNTAFLRALLRHPDVAAGRLDTGLVERHLDDLVDTGVPDEVYAAAALERLLALEPAGPVVDPWEIPGGWRLGEPARSTWRIGAAGHDGVDVRIRGRAAAAQVAVGDADPLPAAIRRNGHGLEVGYGRSTRHYACAREHDVCWLGHDGRSWALTESEPLAAARAEATSPVDGVLRSPMPGTVLTVSAATGDTVLAGQPLLVVEAMKMEHTIAAPIDGVVDLHVRTGQQVAVDAVLVSVNPQE